jgi:hypothetical protein
VDIEGYGTLTPRLPRWLVLPQKRDGNDGPSVRWVGADGVRILSSDEHVALYTRSVAHMPRDSWGSIDWLQIDAARYVLRAELGDPAISEFLDSIAGEQVRTVLIWQSTGYPSLEVDARLVVNHWSDLVDNHDEFHFFIESDRLLVDKGLDDKVTAMRL